jgi:hypothetical protein
MIRGVPGVGVINRARLGRGERDEDPIWVRGASAPCLCSPRAPGFFYNYTKALTGALFYFLKIKKEGKTSNIVPPSLKECTSNSYHR